MFLQQLSVKSNLSLSDPYKFNLNASKSLRISSQTVQDFISDTEYNETELNVGKSEKNKKVVITYLEITENEQKTAATSISNLNLFKRQ